MVKVPQSILEGLEMVRESGEVNMLDRKGAQVVANKLERYDLVIWLEDNREDYAKGLFEGFEAE